MVSTNTMISEYVAKQRADALLVVMIGKDLVEHWWGNPNKAFDLRTPAAVWAEDYHKVYNYLMSAASN